jgi:hypothetical protein
MSSLTITTSGQIYEIYGDSKAIQQLFLLFHTYVLRHMFFDVP